MQLCLGRRAYDVSARALVVGTVPAPVGPQRSARAVAGEAARLVTDGADVVEVAAVDATGDEADGAFEALVGAVVAAVEVPVGVVTRRASTAEAAFAAGACVVRDPSGFADPRLPPAAAAAGATVVATPVAAPAGAGAAARDLAGLAARAEAAGTGPERLVLDLGLEGRAPAPALGELRRAGELAGLGRHLAVGATGSVVDAARGGGTRRDAGLAVVALAVSLGCRMVRTDDVRGARLVRDVLAAVLEAR